MNIVNDDTIFTGRVIMAKEAGDNGDPNYGNFANKTGDSRINFKVADGIDDQDAVSLKQLKAVKDLAFDFIGETEPTDVVEGYVWLDTSFKGRATVRVRKLTTSGAVWVSSIDNISEDLKAEIQALEAKVDKIFASSDGKYALKEGSIDNIFNVAKAINPFNAVNLSQLNDVNSSLVNKIADVDNTKADKTDVYDKNTILSLIEALVPKDSIVGPFNIKGKLTNAELQVLPDPASGDIYYVTDENTWAVRLGNEWFKDRNLLNDGKYFTKQQIIALVEDKASKSDLQAVNQEIEQIKQQIGTIDEAEVNRLIQAAIVNMVKTDGGQTFTKAVKYDDSVTIDDNVDGKTLVHKEYVDKAVAGSGGGVSPSNTYTRQEIDVMLKNYALIDETVTDAELNNTLKNLFRNRNDLNWKGYKNSLPEIEAVLNPEVGDIYGIVSVTKTTPIYMYDGYKWMALSQEEFSKGSTIVIDNPSLENSDTPDKGKKMLKIPMPAGSVVQVLGVYVNNAGNSSLDEVSVDTIIKNDNLVIYINADDISKIIYITDKGDNNLIDMRAVAKLHRDNIFAENNTFNKNVTILENATEDTHALNRVTADGRYAQLAADNTFTGNNVFNNAVKGGNATEDNHLLNRVTADGRYGQLLTQNLEWTVGSGGKFSNLNDAIYEVNKYSLYNPAFKIVLKIKNGFDLSSRINLISKVPLIVQGENGRADVMNIQDTSAVLNIYDSFNIITIQSITLSSKVKYCLPIQVNAGGSALVNDCTIEGSNSTCISALHGGNLQLINSNLSTTITDEIDKGYCLQSHHGANVVLFNRNNLSGGSTALRATSGGNINSVWWYSTRDKTKITGNFNNFCSVNKGGIIFNNGLDITGATFSGSKYSQTPGTWTNNGFISTNI